MSAATIPKAEADYQLARPDEFSCRGLVPYTIVFLAVVTVALGLRLWARSLSKIQFKSDDYTLLLGWALGVGCQACMIVMIMDGGLCRHTLTVSRERFAISGKAGYGFDVLYTTSYPISRISLLLLYKRIFIQRWFRLTCWVLIGCYAGYAIGSMIADFLGTLPVNAKWNPDVKVTHQIDGPSLYKANSIFNIATDAFLLILPLITIWRLRMTRAQKIGVSAIFCLGVLTIIASIFRLITYSQYNKYDPQWGLPSTAWWTTTELCLGLLCPCLVTFGPLVRYFYRGFSSRLSHNTKYKLDKATGSSQSYIDEQQAPSRKKSEFGAYGPLGNEVDAMSPKSMKSQDSQLETGIIPLQNLPSPAPVAQAITTDYIVHQQPPPAPSPLPQPPPPAATNNNAMPFSDEEALANLDPRMSARNSMGRPQNLGTHTEAVKDYAPQTVPYSGIAVSRDYRLESEYERGG